MTKPHSIKLLAIFIGWARIHLYFKFIIATIVSNIVVTPMVLLHYAQPWRLFLFALKELLMALTLYDKKALSFEEQLNQLQARGLQVKNSSTAIKSLSQISYYRLSAYWYPFRKKDSISAMKLDEFHDDSFFEDAVTLYDFDRQLRLHILNAIERIEVFLRTKITYHFAH